MTSGPNPVELEIMRNRWRSAAEEMCAALVRASFSTNIKDRRDCSTAVALPNGDIIAQAEVGTPLHLGIMPSVIRSVLNVIPAERMPPGTRYITNLPYPEGPGHLPDISMVSAVHHDGKVVALTASTAHHIDVGGYSPGSMPFGVTEIYQEGLQIPPVAIIRDGKLDETLYRLIDQNVRTQDVVRGDLLAQSAAARIGEKRVTEMFANRDPGEMTACMQAILDHAEACMRAAIRRLPDGEYTFEDFLDDDGVSDEPVRIRVAVTVRDDTLTADFTGSSRQVLGPLNARIGAARSAVYYVCKMMLDPELPTCAGAYRPVRVVAPEGSILQARFPAAIGNANILTDQRIVDVLLGALHAAAPERVCAACSGEMNLVNLGGIDDRTGQYFNYVETYGGGQGALFDRDGQDGIHTHLTNTRNTPVEVIEQTYPLEVLRYALVPGSGGAGRYRGGCGLERVIRCLADRATLTVGADRRVFRPWGLEGGEPGASSDLFVTCPDGTKRQLPTKVVTGLQRGDVLTIRTPGGGGWGPADARKPEAVERDRRSGLAG